MVVTAHTPNFLPGLSVVEKIRASDAVIFLDETQYTHGGWSNRNRMPDGSWLTIPVAADTNMAAFNRVKIGHHRAWRMTAVKTLTQHYGDPVYPLTVELLRPYKLLIGLNLALLRVILDRQRCRTQWVFQSHLDGGHAVQAANLYDEARLAVISQRLAMMTSELGGTTYLSGTSGRNYLDESPFAARGIAVDYFEWDGPNPCSASLLARPVAA